MRVCWTSSSGTMLENTGMKAGKSSASTSCHKAVPTWCKGTKRKQQIWQRPLGKIDKEQVNSSLLTLTCFVPTAKDHSTLRKSKANQSKLFCITVLAPDGKSLGGQHTRCWPPQGCQVGRAQAEDPAPHIHCLCLRKDVTRQEGGQWCAQSKRRGSRVSTLGRLCHFKLFHSCWLLFLMLL